MTISRVDKLFADRDQLSPDEARRRRQNFKVVLVCGEDVAASYSLQLAVLTATNLASRCFPGAVTVVVPPGLRAAKLLLWPTRNLNFDQGLAEVLPVDAVHDAGAAPVEGSRLLFGDVGAREAGFRVTFDGWIAKVGPAGQVARLQERQYCSLAPMLAAALAVSELFLAFAGIEIEATRRVVGVSLWRPDLDITNPDALGGPVEFLPAELWAFGLGHLGNAYLWALATLPYQDPGAVTISLTDTDKIIKENYETSVLFKESDAGRRKTRVSSAWLEVRGFETRLVEKWVDANFRRRTDGEGKEPLLALCGFDSNPARRDLAGAGFHIVDSGLGARAQNFDVIGFHTFPGPRQPEEIWPDPDKKELDKQIAHEERTARENPAYAQLAEDECGRVLLAGKSVAVPFVGAAAAAFVVAESLRRLHGGPAYADIRARLGSPNRVSCTPATAYSAADVAGLPYCEARTF